jgi:hypothetical protein
MLAQRADRTTRNVTPFPLKDVPAEGGPRRKPSWVTNDAADWVNSLCPNQAEFPAFIWCDAAYNLEIKNACTAAFNKVKAGWNDTCLERLRLTITENRILAVIERKTLRYGKLFELIPRKTFINGDARTDKDGFPIVRPTGLSDGNLSTGLASLKSKRAVGCIKALPYNGKDPSTVYCILPSRQMLSMFFGYVSDELARKVSRNQLDADHYQELVKRFRMEMFDRCGGIMREDEAHAPVQN